MQASTSSAVSSSSHPSSSSAGGKPDRLYVGNLSPTVDEYTLIQVFSKYGKITKLDFMFHKTGVLKGKPRGFAFIQFSDKDDALKAMVKLHDRLLRGRKLVVTYASSAPVDNLPFPTKGRRPTEPAKTTTLSLLKSNRKPQSAAAQIAAMEAKLAFMASRKPADEDWVPGSGSASGSRAETPILDEGMPVEGSPLPEDALGEEEGGKAADDLEKEMEAELQHTTSPNPVLTSVSKPPTESPDSSLLGNGENGALPPKPEMSVDTSAHDRPTKMDEKTKEKEESIRRGLASLPKKPVF